MPTASARFVLPQNPPAPSASLVGVLNFAFNGFADVPTFLTVGSTAGGPPATFAGFVHQNTTNISGGACNTFNYRWDATFSIVQGNASLAAAAHPLDTPGDEIWVALWDTVATPTGANVPVAVAGPFILVA